MELLDFSNFRDKKLQEAIEEEHMNILYEGWSSDIMKMLNIADKNSDRAWFNSFTKDLNKVYNLSIDQIKNEDFTEIAVDAFFKPPYSKNRDILAIFINDDKRLEMQASKDVKEIDEKIKELKDTGGSKDDIERLKKTKDKIREIKTPVITAVAAGQRVLYAGFNYDDQDKKIAQIERYGILSAPWVVKRYFGDAANVKVTVKNIADKATKAYIINLAELKTKYDMGTKTDDRKKAKENNPFFMTSDEIRANNIKRFNLMKHNKIDPNSILIMYKAIIETYTKNYLNSIRLLSDKDFEQFLDDKIKIDNKELPSSGVFITLDNYLRNYFKTYIAYTTFLKDSEDIIADVRAKETSKETLSTEEQKYKNQNDGFIEALVDHKKRAQALYSDMKSGNLKFTKKDEKVLG